jgi:heterodisulfide reductase subunit B
MQKKFEKELGVPIIYFTQIIGLALGIPPKKLGLDKNFTSTKKVRDFIEAVPESSLKSPAL